MSDRAKTNIAFTQLLIEYRKDIMPDVIDGWNVFTEEQKNACWKINNFFCGLHLLVERASVAFCRKLFAPCTFFRKSIT
jgi:hypothetical protein